MTTKIRTDVYRNGSLVFSDKATGLTDSLEGLFRTNKIVVNKGIVDALEDPSLNDYEIVTSVIQLENADAILKRSTRGKRLRKVFDNHMDEVEMILMSYTISNDIRR